MDRVMRKFARNAKTFRVRLRLEQSNQKILTNIDYQSDDH